MNIKTLIVDDEPLARERIRTLLKNESDVVVCGEAQNGKEAQKKLSDERCDLLFLDIQMPEMDGIRMVEKIPTNKLPLIVFTTAYDSYAVKAFELNAVDYLLKPFTKKRFQQSLDRVREHLRSENKELYSASVLNALQSIVNKKQFPERIVVKSEGRIVFVPLKEIMWVESDANYIDLHTVNSTVVIRETMSAFSQRLDPSMFLRTHRSVVVNTHFIKEMKPWFNNELVIVLNNGTQLPVGRTYRKHVLHTLR